MARGKIVAHFRRRLGVGRTTGDATARRRSDAASFIICLTGVTSSNTTFGSASAGTVRSAEKMRPRFCVSIKDSRKASCSLASLKAGGA